MSIDWSGPLTWDDDARAYVGLVVIASFPYRIKVERDWRADGKVVTASVSIWEGPKT